MKLFLISLLSVFTLQGLEPRAILNEKAEILLPSNFDLMSEEMLAVKYPSSNRPTLVYGNEDGSVNLAINHTQNRISLEQLPEALPAFSNQFENLYPSATWFRSEMTQIDGRDFIVLELITPAADTRIYNLMFITSLEERMLMFSFNCTEELMSEWQSQGQEMMNSVKIK